MSIFYTENGPSPLENLLGLPKTEGGLAELAAPLDAVPESGQVLPEHSVVDAQLSPAEEAEQPSLPGEPAQEEDTFGGQTAEEDVDPPAKRRRTSRKKEVPPPAEDPPAPPEGDAAAPEGQPDAPLEPMELETSPDQEPDDSIPGNKPAEGEPAVPPEPPQAGEAPAVPPRPRENRPMDPHTPLMALDLHDLDRNLSREEREEWNEIYASYRSKSIITGTIIGVDANAFQVRNRETGALERRRMYCAVVIAYRVKVLIPEAEFWVPGEERPSHVLRNMTGAEIDYVILDVDRQGGVAVASRRMGAAARRHRFDTARGGHTVGERLSCRVLSVGPSRCLLECGGRDITLGYREMSYSSIHDLRTVYRPGQPLDCVLTAYDRAAGTIEISVREAEPNPFEGIEVRHPLHSRRQATITGKYAGGVFCTLPDGTTCLCLYTPQHTDRDFHIGDSVILTITQFDQDRGLIYGRILSRW